MITIKGCFSYIAVLMTDNRPMAYKCSIDGERLLYSVQYGFYLLFCEINDWLILPIICSIDAELEDLREFYDPDTVDLMQWIQQNTHQVMTLIFNLSFWKARTRQYGCMFEPPAEVQLIPDKRVFCCMGTLTVTGFIILKDKKSPLMLQIHRLGGACMVTLLLVYNDDLL